MVFSNQTTAIYQLQQLANTNKQSILIIGEKGVGKSYLAKQYSSFIRSKEYFIIQPKISELKETIDYCYTVQDKITLCIENLDLALDKVSYTILKFLEEPPQNVYIIISCRNIKNIPDTIVSRCATVNISNPAIEDIKAYAMNKNKEQYDIVKEYKVWNCVACFTDIDELLKMNPTQLSYFDTLMQQIIDAKSVNSALWKLQKFPDNIPISPILSIRYIMLNSDDKTIWYLCNECIKDLNIPAIPNHVVLAKLVFQLKYAI